MTDSDRLVVLWTSSDKEVAINMVFMYALNSKLRKWWKEVCLIVWGPSAKLLCEDSELQSHMAKMKDAGVELVACKACSDNYGVSDELERFGIEVRYMGEPLTQMLKQGDKILTF